jgi:short-subunit dehydrogenase
MVAVVTGASSGIGAATARRLASEPEARLVLVARREDRLRALADEIGGATVVAVDLTEPDAPARVADAVEREHGRLDLLVNNAGAVWFGELARGGFADIRRHMEVNFDAPVRLTEALLPLLRRSAPSSIVNVASLAARIGPRGLGAYSASKFALAGWSDVLHLEERRNGVHVGLVLPGPYETEIFGDLSKRTRRERLLMAAPEKAVDAILAAGPGGRAERWAPRRYWIFGAMRVLAPSLLRRVTARRSGRARLRRLASRIRVHT